MSILRQLLLSITIALTVILLGSLALNISAARDYLAGQLQAQSQDAAVSLALSLSQPGNGEPVTQELLISAMFDDGHYSRIVLSSPENKILIERQVEDSNEYDAPDWFRALMPINVKSATRPVTDGWRQIGNVTIVANDVYAWESLWQGSLRMVMLIVAAGLTWTAFAFALVRWIQGRLLAEISKEVQAIGQGQLQGQSMRSHVRELSGVVQAINQARERLRISAAEQHDKVEALEFELNRDETTGIANRRYFLNEFRRAINLVSETVRDTARNGHVIVFHLRDLADINEYMRRRPTDQWLTSVCQQISDILSAATLSEPALLARLNGADFAVLLPDSEFAVARDLAERIREKLLQTRAHANETTLCRWHLSLTNYGTDANISAVLTRLDLGLTQAENTDSDAVIDMTVEQ